jgi:probable HAF family extracellular repeat protein
MKSSKIAPFILWMVFGTFASGSLSPTSQPEMLLKGKSQQNQYISGKPVQINASLPDDFFTTPAARQAGIKTTRLGTLGGDASYAAAINEAGQVIGQSKTKNGELHAFFWSGEHGMLDIGTLGGPSSCAKAINEAGQVIGYSTTQTGQTHAFIWSREHGIQDIGTLGGPGSVAYYINEKGSVAGKSTTSEGKDHAFVWGKEIGLRDLGPISKRHGISNEILEKNEFKTRDTRSPYGAHKTAEGHYIAFYYDSKSDQEITLGTLGGNESIPTATNNIGQVIGNSTIKSGAKHIFLWTKESGMMDVGPAGNNIGYAIGFNNKSQLLGYVVYEHENKQYSEAILWELPKTSDQNTR